jgi:hypothetical protein
VDFQSHGDSPRSESSHNVSRYAPDVHVLLERLQLTDETAQSDGATKRRDGAFQAGDVPLVVSVGG